MNSNALATSQRLKQVDNYKKRGYSIILFTSALKCHEVWTFYEMPYYMYTYHLASDFLLYRVYYSRYFVAPIAIV